MEYGELYIEAERPTRNARTGRYLKGHVPHNVGKRWEEYMSEDGRRNAMKGWENVRLHQYHGGAGAIKMRKKVIAINPSGKWLVFESLAKVAEWTGGTRAIIRRCCLLNESGKVLTKGEHKGSTNTDHKYKGIRFYFEANPVWTTKIKQ